MSPFRSLPLRVAILTLLAFMATAAQSAVDARYSAHWYAPERSGEGWMLEILDPGSALVYWFTYDEQGRQRWLFATGTIADNVIDFEQVVLTTGGRFGDAFDPDQVVREDVGSLRIEFADCQTGELSFDAFGQQQTVTIRRLITAMDLACAGDEPGISNGRAGQSGSWFDPDRSGEGYSLQWMTDGQMLMVWYTYTPDGELQWMLGVGELQGNAIVFDQVEATRGARFGAAFDPGDVERYLWGGLRLELDCSAGPALYDASVPGFGEGRLDLVQLTRLDGVDCTVDQQPNLDLAQWSVTPGNGPLLSEFPAVMVGDHAYLAGGMFSATEVSSQFWRYTPATDTWTRLADMPSRRDHGMMTALDGGLHVLGGYSSGPFAAVATNTHWRYDIASGQWSTRAPMPRTRAAGGAATINGEIFVAGGRMSAGDFIDRYLPDQDQWQSQTLLGFLSSRDHASVVAFNNELWLIAGRHHQGFNNRTVLILDPATGLTRPGPSLTTARSGFAATVLGNRIVVAGGESLATQEMLETTEYYEPAHGQWREIPVLMPLAVHGGPAVAHDGRVLVLLGSTVLGDLVSTGKVQVLTPADP